ncbi:hypothetical protein VTP01DRAFT_5665 [Rhizomucor pusillus]|uniref:uncharacterized protein n=1 Tax=Rhizomucor pusillus TaxID=4840 RepID=UPI003744A825
MLYDFNIPYPSNPDPSDLRRLERILFRIQSIQNATIALNLTTTDAFVAKTAEAIKPIAPDRFGKHVKQMTRITVTATEAKKNYMLVSTNAANQSVDILAVRPTNIDICKHACQNYDVDIISIDCSIGRSLPNHASAQVAISRGIFFEICYAQAFRTKEKRSMFFQNVKRLVEVTRGDNLIFSSEALHALDIRRPSDMRMLGLLFGLRQDQIKAATGYNYQRLLLKAETRKSTLNAAIKAEPIPGQSNEQSSGEVDSKRKLEDESKTQKKKQKIQ